MLTVLVFLLGFKIPDVWLSDENRTDECRRELHPDQWPSPEVAVELSSEVLPVRSVCTWANGLTAEVEYGWVDDLTIRLLFITVLTGLLSLALFLAVRRRAAVGGAPEQPTRPLRRLPEGKPPA
ncbi:hypothetical protein E1265_15120 [Streptomyces sp. 8K308]|uniref:hypothetical protein n=1 Tax=Streptomyces sp. 8K308 TaxID=2530388 RepID=UPI00104B81D7|nr:hypothetical protein [Streptomyces sp. 8K308]TDC22656.1 hypothetical protein E1265_15120 [Streptomyces sp. 8K308]